MSDFIDNELPGALDALDCEMQRSVDEIQQQLAEQWLGQVVSTFERKGIRLELILVALSHVVKTRNPKAADLLSRAADTCIREAQPLAAE